MTSNVVFDSGKLTIRRDGTGGYIYDHYGTLKDAARMKKWSRDYDLLKKCYEYSRQKLIKHFENLGYNVKRDGSSLELFSKDAFIVVFMYESDQGIRASYEVTDYYGLFDDRI